MHQLPCLGIFLSAAMEIRTHPIAQVNRFANVNHFSVGILHQVAAGIGGQIV
jgi:hypothetical protein